MGKISLFFCTDGFFLKDIEIGIWEAALLEGPKIYMWPRAQGSLNPALYVSCS